MLLNEFLAGAACISLLVIAMFFIRFWLRTRDRLFVFFAAAFLVLMLERIIRATMVEETEWAPYVYSVRLVAFSLILVAIVDKNRRT
jgi:hypothetical protein